MNHDIAAIVVTYNRKDMLIECINHIQGQQGAACDIIVIDNASTDGTEAAVASLIESEEIIYVNTGANLGGAGGFNYGIRYAVEHGYQRLWIMDDDTMPTSTALEALLKADAQLNGDYGFLSSRVLWKDNTICAMNIQKENKWSRLKDFDNTRPIQYASFVSLFMRAETVIQVGLPYKEFFIWADDWEYTRRISRQKSAYYIPTSTVHHWCATNVGADIVSAPADRIDRFKYMYRNDVVLYRQDGFEGKLYLSIRNMAHRLRILLKSEHKGTKLGIIRDATKEGKRFAPKKEYPRI